MCIAAVHKLLHMSIPVITRLMLETACSRILCACIVLHVVQLAKALWKVLLISGFKIIM